VVRTTSRRLEAVVVGGSAGALDALDALLAGLPASFDTSILLVVHVPAAPPNLLPQVLATRTRLAVCEARDKQPIAPATLYIAPADYHLLVERERTLSLSRDPAVSFTRPSIDVLFESAAAVYGPAVAGIILTGANSDGAAGLAAIAAAGGLTAVQDPATAQSRQMPRAAIAAVPGGPDVVAEPRRLAAWLAQVASAIGGRS
jgi:two-component system chemotaxis response regulator CheB